MKYPIRASKVDGFRTSTTITIRHQLDLTRTVSTSSNRLFFRGLPRCLRPLGLIFSITFAILLLFILLHVVVDFICIFVAYQLVLLSSLRKFLLPFCGQKSSTDSSSEQFNQIAVNNLLPFCLRVQISFPCRRMG